MTMPRLGGSVGGIVFQNPVFLAAGTAAYADELAAVMDLDALGGLVTKAVSVEPRAGAPAPRVAEFPGGKCETDETPRSCAVRECREETGLLVIPREQLATVAHSYAHGDVELHFWKCGLGPDLPEDVSPNAPFRWVTLEELARLDFPAANRTVLDQLLNRMK